MIVKYDKLPERLQMGLQMLEKYQCITLGDAGVEVVAAQGDEISIEKCASRIAIVYDTEPHFYMALARAIGMKEGVQKIEPKIKNLGVMLDCSRNAVAKPDTLKRFICLMTLAGYTYFQLYTEETYELPGEPYFGYKRGRYTAEELKEVIAFAEIFGMEVVPCIQTLAHLKNLANWKPYFDHMDINDILLVGDERTYDLIRKCLKFCKETFNTKRIHIGTDEAFHLGRGKYVDQYGYRSKHEIYVDHLKRVFEICKEEGMEPEFWADAFYDTDVPKEEVQALFDGTQTPIYWDYYKTDVNFHREKMQTLKEYAGKVSYAGGLWKWFGYAPDNHFSDMVHDTAFEAAMDCGVSDILITIWGDNGDECPLFAIIPSLWYAANQLYPCEMDINLILEEVTGYTDEEWRTCDELNYDFQQNGIRCNTPKYALHNDFLIGLLDYHILPNLGEIFGNMIPNYQKLAEKDSPYAYIFRMYAALCQALTLKSTYSLRLRAAYQAGDQGAMQELVEELKPIREDIAAFYKVYRTLWMTENKGYGFEVMDVRIGGLISRIETVTEVLNDYLAGKTDKIYELEDDSIDYWAGALPDEDRYIPTHNFWGTLYTVNHI